jgi:hypothetical protein
MKFPAFDAHFPELNRFIEELVKEYQSGNISSWENLDDRVKVHFTLKRMEQMESLLPGWKKMTSFSDGITLVHVMCVFLGMMMLPEFESLTPQQQQLAKWIILFHDIDKFHIRGKKDTMHAFRSGVIAANLLPRFGFPTRQHYLERIDQWSQYTTRAFIQSDVDATQKPDNQKLRYILIGIDNLFGKNTPAALITKTVLMHISLSVDPFYPTPAPLTKEEAKRYIGSDLLPLLRVMMLSDNEGWSLFNAKVRERQRTDTLNVFANLERMMST